MISTADHVLVREAMLAAGVRQEVHKSWVAGSWRVLIYGRDRRTDSAARCDCIGSCFEIPDQLITPLFIDVTNIQFEDNAAGNAVHKARKDIADAAGCNRIDRSGGP